SGVQEDVAIRAREIESEKKHPVSAAENHAAERLAADIGDHDHDPIEKIVPLIGDKGTKAAKLFGRLTPNDQQKVAATWQEYRTRMIVALDAYYQLPREQDAYAAEKKLDAKMK